ncbi:MAG: hypothetical protein ABI336_11935, partial [Humibacillus sp.]
MTTIGASSSCTNHTYLGDRAPVRPEQLFARGGESGFEADRVVPGPGATRANGPGGAGGVGGGRGAAGTGSCAAVLPAVPDCELTFPWAGVGDDELVLATGARSLLDGRAYARIAESSDSISGSASLLYSVLDFGASPGQLSST